MSPAIAELLFKWDKDKAEKNLRKHKVSFEETKTIFNDSFMLTFSDEYHSDNEKRYISIGTSADKRILLVVHAEYIESEKTVIRIISSRKATKSERRLYEEESQTV